MRRVELESRAMAARHRWITWRRDRSLTLGVGPKRAQALTRTAEHGALGQASSDGYNVSRA